MSRTTAPPVHLLPGAPGAPSPRGPAPGVRVTTTVGLVGLAALLAALGTAVGLGRAGWAVGLGGGAALTAAFARGLAGAGRESVGPADLVTLSRGLLACGVAALTTEALLGQHVRPALLVLAVPALALDAVDGWVARRTGTVTAFGGRFDGEVDAFLILVLSVYVAPSAGWWVVAAGLARYAFAAAGWVCPWLRGRLEFRYWRKVVTATVGITLVVAASEVLPRWPTVIALVAALALLAESFGRDVWSLWRRRPGVGGVAPSRGPREARGGAAVNVMALLLVWFALSSPSRPDHLTYSSVLRIPVEALVIGGLVLAVSARWRRVLTMVVGVLLGVLTVLKLLDLGSHAVLGRPFDLVSERSLLGSGVDFVEDSLGEWAAGGAVLAAVVLAGGIVLCLPLAVERSARLLRRHGRVALRVLLVVAASWVAAAVTGLHAGSAGPIAAADTAHFVAGKVRATADAVRDQRRFAAAVAADAFGDPASRDLAALRGKDVLLVFVESYGRVAVEGRGSAPVRELLDAGTARLRASGYTARSAFLTSPTFGGSSWLAHATLKSGIRVDDQWRHDRLLASSRTSLTSAFGGAGWRTVAVLPSNRRPWPEGQAFYRFDTVYDRSSLGYAGPRFGFSAMPDQYALSALERLELATSSRAPVMAEVDLTSSHGPWAPLPSTVDWGSLGDGSVFDGIRERAVTAKQLWSDRRDVPDAYRASIAYSLTSVVSFVDRHDGELVVVLLGDHQPSTIVSGSGGNRDVPVTVVARDPAVIDRIAGWGWREGLGPDEAAPVWPMEAFRDRFLAAYSSPSTSQPSPASRAPE